MHRIKATIVALAAGASANAIAATGDPINLGNGLVVDPIVDARLRYENVDQPTTGADALTLRVRAGAEFRVNQFSLLAETESTMALVNDYNAFPFVVQSGQRRPQFSTISDPSNIELNRLQLQWKGGPGTLTLGRQRINLDDQRWVGSVGWRQNEQTFDAVRAEAKLGPVVLDGTYAIGQRTIFGIDGGPRQSYGGDFLFLGAGGKAGPVNLKAFAYLVDYDEPFFYANSSKTFGLRATAALPLAPSAKLNLAASYARQSDTGRNPVAYAANYLAADAALGLHDFTLNAGYELLGSDGRAAAGAARAVQTPMATLHKFNGWADMFLSTPNTGLRDIYAGAAYRFSAVKAVPGLNAAVTWHRFDSDIRSIHYGNEWDASLGFKLGRVGLLAKYANYDARGFGLDTSKFWLQAEVAY